MRCVVARQSEKYLLRPFPPLDERHRLGVLDVRDSRSLLFQNNSFQVPLSITIWVLCFLSSGLLWLRRSCSQNKPSLRCHVYSVFWSFSYRDTLPLVMSLLPLRSFAALVDIYMPTSTPTSPAYLSVLSLSHTQHPQRFPLAELPKPHRVSCFSTSQT